MVPVGRKRLKTKTGTAVPCPYFADGSLLGARCGAQTGVSVPPRRLIVAALRAELAGGWGLLVFVLILTRVRLAPLFLGLALCWGK
jgi:hypothetical protein